MNKSNRGIYRCGIYLEYANVAFYRLKANHHTYFNSFKINNVRNSSPHSESVELTIFRTTMEPVIP